MSTIVSPKLNGVNPKNIIVLADYDWTLASKHHPDPDHAPLTAEHYQGLIDLAQRISRFVIITARGEQSILGYLGEHVPTLGRLPNTTLASNSGHWWHDLDRPRQDEPNIIEIPGQTRTGLQTLTAAIHKMAMTLQMEYPEITIADHRELCGTVVYKFDGTKETNPRFKELHKRAEILATDIYTKLNAGVFFSTNDWFDEGACGYIDILPVGMSKGHTTPIIFNHYAQEITGKPFVIVAGDSKPDYEMMKAIALAVPPEQRLLISVGHKLTEFDNAGLLDHVLRGNGKGPVPQLHDFLATVGAGTRDTKLDRVVRGQGREPEGQELAL